MLAEFKGTAIYSKPRGVFTQCQSAKEKAQLTTLNFAVVG
jgi:hypothetical protein